ncbi:MAG: GNAT family N-acetyltransferase [Bauldia sp.]
MTGSRAADIGEAEVSPEMRFPPPEPFDAWVVPPEKTARRARPAVVAEPAKPVAAEVIEAAQKALDALDAVAIEPLLADPPREDFSFELPAAEPQSSTEPPIVRHRLTAVVEIHPDVVDLAPDPFAREFVETAPLLAALDPPAPAALLVPAAPIADDVLAFVPPKVEQQALASPPVLFNPEIPARAEAHDAVEEPATVSSAIEAPALFNPPEVAAPPVPPAARAVTPPVAKSIAPAWGFALVPMNAAPVDEWAALALRDSADSVFFDPAFMLPLVRHLGGATALATVRNGRGELIAAAPLAPVRLGRIAPAFRLFGNPYAPLGAPLVDGEALDAGISGLVEGLAARGRSLVVPDLPLDGPIAEIFRAMARRTRRPVVTLGEHLRGMLLRPATGSANPREALSAKRRNEYRRQMLRLADQGVVAIDSVTEEAAVRAAFEEFLDLEASGWKGRARTALLSRNATVEFARASVAALASEGRARIDTIRLVGQPIAVLVSFVAGATAYTWKIAYDESQARFSPGAQLMLEAGRSIFASTAVERIDSCAVADHPMVDHVWKDRAAIGTLIVGPPGGGALYALGGTSARAEIAAKAALRKLRRRRG